MVLVHNSQQSHFHKIPNTLEDSLKELRRLSPFVDELGIIRVGGRLDHSSLPYTGKHPALLPKSCHLANLLIDETHSRHYHSGPTLTLSLLRGQFWILGGLKYVRNRILRCVRCRIRKVKPMSSFMAPLPKERVIETRAFLNVGVDFAGPFLIKNSNRRNSLSRKAYLCLFVCFSTKALHLEAVSSLSTPSFLAALDRFLARRGFPQQIQSDNASNFIGASRFIKDVWLSISKSEDAIIRTLAPRGVVWKFNPPKAPNFGGLWEAGVKSVKNLLASNIGKQSFTFEELTTAFCRIEALLNSRPLCPISEDHTSCDFLSPGHFIVGSSLTTMPEQSSPSEASPHPRSRWKCLQSRLSSFWERWRREYLHTLQQRGKWLQKSRPFKTDDLAILVEKRSLIGQWPVCRVIDTHPGDDGVVRVVTVQTPSGNKLVRSTNSLAPLFYDEPIIDDADIGIF